MDNVERAMMLYACLFLMFLFGIISYAEIPDTPAGTAVVTGGIQESLSIRATLLIIMPFIIGYCYRTKKNSKKGRKK